MNLKDPRIITDDDVLEVVQAQGHTDVQGIELIQGSIHTDGMTGYWKITTPGRVFWIVLAKKAGEAPATPRKGQASTRGTSKGGRRGA